MLYPYTCYEPEALGQYLKTLRVNTKVYDLKQPNLLKSLSQIELAEKMGTKRQTIINTEKGKAKQPTAEFISRWINATTGNIADLESGLLLAGHKANTVMPTVNDLKIGLKDAAVDLENILLPA